MPKSKPIKRIKKTKRSVRRNTSEKNRIKKKKETTPHPNTDELIQTALESGCFGILAQALSYLDRTLSHLRSELKRHRDLGGRQGGKHNELRVLVDEILACVGKLLHAKEAFIEAQSHQIGDDRPTRAALSPKFVVPAVAEAAYTALKKSVEDLRRIQREIGEKPKPNDKT